MTNNEATAIDSLITLAKEVGCPKRAAYLVGLSDGLHFRALESSEFYGEDYAEKFGDERRAAARDQPCFSDWLSGFNAGLNSKR